MKTPGHFLIGRPIKAIPDPPIISQQSVTLLRQWHLCQVIVRHFWKRWSTKYLVHLNCFNKWRHPTGNIEVGDIVLMKEDNVTPTQWPLGRVTQVYRS